MTVRWMLLTALCAWYLPSGVSAQPPATGRKLAFLVGGTDYDHAKLTQLRYSENDVVELAKLLEGQGYQVTLLTSSGGKKAAAQQPTAANIRAQLAKLLEGANRRDLILVGLAGHGLQLLDQDESFFCPQDANPSTTGFGPEARFNRPETLLGINELLKALDDSGVGQKLVLIDASRSNPNDRGRRGAIRQGIGDIRTLPRQTGVILSCSPGEFAFDESRPGGGGHGVFFQSVMEGLRGEAADSGGEVTWNGLVDYVEKHVPSKVEELFGADGGRQTPNAVSKLSGKPAVLARSQNVSPAPPKSRQDTLSFKVPIELTAKSRPVNRKVLWTATTNACYHFR